MNYCMGCHSLQYERYQRFQSGLGVPEDLVMKHLRFDSSAKIGDLMKNAMPVADAKQWFGAPPPDLTLIARSRGVDYLYTYLRTFYKDPARPWGVNNKAFPDVGMPHVLLELQGLAGMRARTCSRRQWRHQKRSADWQGSIVRR